MLKFGFIVDSLQTTMIYSTHFTWQNGSKTNILTDLKKKNNQWVYRFEFIVYFL